MVVKELSDYGLTFDLISKFCKKKIISWYLRFSRSWLLLSGVAEGGGRKGGGHRRFEGTYVSISALYRMFVCLLEHTYHSLGAVTQKTTTWLLTIAEIQILCIWYMSAHNTCLSVLVQNRLQEKSARRSAVRLESLNNWPREDRPREGWGGGDKSEVNDIRNLECRSNSFNCAGMVTQSSQKQKPTGSCIFQTGTD